MGLVPTPKHPPKGKFEERQEIPRNPIHGSGILLSTQAHTPPHSQSLEYGHGASTGIAPLLELGRQWIPTVPSPAPATMPTSTTSPNAR